MVPRGDRCEANPHHVDPSSEVDAFKPSAGGVRWYIKSYLVESDEFAASFIGVHESDHQ